MNILKQDIGVFFKTREWAEEVWDRIMSSIPEYRIVRGKYKSEDEWIQYNPRYVRLDDGTKIRLLRLLGPQDLDNIRGLKLDKIYYEAGLGSNFEFVDSLFRCMRLPQVKDLEINEITYETTWIQRYNNLRNKKYRTYISENILYVYKRNLLDLLLARDIRDVINLVGKKEREVKERLRKYGFN